MINLKRLKGLRVENGYTQKDMADLLELSVMGYRLKENGENPINLEEAAKIADILKKPVEHIFFTK